MSLSSACTAEFTLQARPSSVTEAMLKKCISSDKVQLKSLTMKTMKSTKRSQFFTYLNILTSEIIKSCTTLSPTQFSKLWPTLQTTRARIKLSNCQTSSSCVSLRTFYVSYAICSHKQLKTSRDVPLKEDIDSCFKRIPTPKSCRKRKTNKTRILRTQEAILVVMINLITETKMELTMRTNLKTSTRTKNQRTLRARRKT